MIKDSTKTMGVVDSDAKCVGFHELLDWQILQYRQVVDEYRHDLSVAEGRCISWQEAEESFTAERRELVDDQSRVEYCGMICPSRTNCLSALNFLHKKNTEPLYKVG
jgi:hypothetical protein